MPVDYMFDITDGCSIGTSNWAVDGSVIDIVFSISPYGNINTTKWDITRIIFKCDGAGMSNPSDKTPDYTAFFTMDQVTNGAYLRTVDGHTKNIFNVKNNGDMLSRMYDVTINTELNKVGLYTTFARRTFAGQDKNGVTIRLNALGADSLEWVIQDDLTSMVSCVAVVQGHIVE